MSNSNPTQAYFGPLSSAPKECKAIHKNSLKDQVLFLPANLLNEPVELCITEPKSQLTVVAAAGAKVEVIFDLVGDNSENFEFEIDVILEPDADITLLNLQHVKAKTVNIKQAGKVERGAKLHWKNITLGGASVDHNLQTKIVGNDALSSVDWVFYARGDEKQKLTARNIFNAANGGGEMLLKGVAEEKATVQCDGMIEIGLKGGGTDTYLTEDVLMLDKTAKVNAIPGLEIKTNDVKASHSAVVSRVTPADLFYFNSRGIAEAEARRMYIEGFLGEITQNIKSEIWREKILEAIDEKYRSQR